MRGETSLTVPPLPPAACLPTAWPRGALLLCCRCRHCSGARQRLCRLATISATCRLLQLGLWLAHACTQRANVAALIGICVCVFQQLWCTAAQCATHNPSCPSGVPQAAHSASRSAFNAAAAYPPAAPTHLLHPRAPPTPSCPNRTCCTRGRFKPPAARTASPPPEGASHPRLPPPHLLHPRAPRGAGSEASWRAGCTAWSCAERGHTHGVIVNNK